VTCGTQHHTSGNSAIDTNEVHIALRSRRPGGGAVAVGTLGTHFTHSTTTAHGHARRHLWNPTAVVFQDSKRSSNTSQGRAVGHGLGQRTRLSTLLSLRDKYFVAHMPLIEDSKTTGKSAVTPHLQNDQGGGAQACQRFKI
jgi:hypothetical protein